MKAERYLNLSIGAPKRLAYLKSTNKDWRRVREWSFKNWEAAHCVLSQGFNGVGPNKVPIWYSHHNPYFRNERPTHEVLTNMRHTGWFSDADCSETLHGMVASLPHGRFIAGYHMTMNGEQVWFDEVFDDVADAARMADEHARVQAEKEREYDQRWQEARSISEDEIPAKLKRREECLLLAMSGIRREEYREEARGLKEEIRELRWKLKHDYADIEF